MHSPIPASAEVGREAPMVKLKPSDGRRHRIPAKLLRVEGDRAVVLPMGHKHEVIVPLESVSMWKSRARPF